MRVDTDSLSNRVYLGDGVYAGWDGYQIWLWTLEGDSIAIEAPVMTMLARYARIFWPSQKEEE
jgi:hypothetical protein